MSENFLTFFYVDNKSTCYVLVLCEKGLHMNYNMVREKKHPLKNEDQLFCCVPIVLRMAHSSTPLSLYSERQWAPSCKIQETIQGG